MSIKVCGMKVFDNQVISIDKLMFLGKTEADIAELVKNPPKGYYILNLPHHNGLVYISEATVKNSEELTLYAPERSIGSIIGTGGAHIKLILEQLKSAFPKNHIHRINILKV